MKYAEFLPEILEAVMEEMQERLKDSNIPAFSDLSGLLDSTPSDKDSHTIAILELNKAIDSKVGIFS